MTTAAVTRKLSIADLERQENSLIFQVFTEATAIDLGLALLKKASIKKAAVVIDIRTSDRTLFHVACPGATPDNDRWAWRKSNVVLRQHRSSMLVGAKLEAAGQTVARELGLDPLDYAAHGGSFPIRTAVAGVTAAVTVSGMASEDDHELIVETIGEFLQK